LKSCWARGTILTLHTTRGFKFVQELFDIFAFALLGLFEPLAYSFPRIRLGGNVEKTLVGLRILKHSFRFAFDSEHDCPFVLLEQLHELAGIAPEVQIPLMPISRSEVIAISAERSDARLF